MEYTKLGTSDIEISRVCLGTMTWGEQNSELEGHEQMNYALEQGVNFWDTAELYSVPTSAGTCGRTEEIIGTWLAKTGRRKDVVLATKLVGAGLPWIRGGDAKIDGANAKVAVEGSLKRLQTDYIDLYQLHWANRNIPHFGNNHAGAVDMMGTTTAVEVDSFLDTLRVLKELQVEGKIREIGLSNETAWGVMKYLELSEKHDLPRIQSLQNEFSLLCRKDDPFVAETVVRENVSYLAWSPLAFSLLGGKYRGGDKPEGSRWAVSLSLGHGANFRDVPMAHDAVDAYYSVAEKHGLNPVEVTLAFVYRQPFVGSTIIGATSMSQLKQNIGAYELKLSRDVLNDINEVYRQYPIPY